MEQLGKIKYYKDNWAYNLKVKFFLTTFLFAFFATLFYRNWPVFGCFSVLLLAQYFIYKIPTGQLEFLFDGQWFWVKNIVGKKETTAKILSYEFFWNNAYLPMGTTKTSTQGDRLSHVNFVELKCLFFLENEKSIALTHELYQWQDAPRDWPCKGFNLSLMDNIFIVHGGLKQLKMEFEITKSNTPKKTS